MADSAIAVDAGTGVNIDTRTEATNSNHRQVVVLGDPSTNAGVAPVDATYGVSVDITRSVAIALAAGTAAIGKLTANSGVDIGDVDILSIAAGDNNIGNVDIASIAAGTTNIGDVDILTTVTPTPQTSGGYSIFFSIDLDETEEEIKATAGQIYGYYFFNAAATTRYLRFYNATAANTTVGTTAAILVLPLPAGTAGHIDFGCGIPFATALSAAVTTGVAANDTGAPDASDVQIDVFYK